MAGPVSKDVASSAALAESGEQRRWRWLTLSPALLIMVGLTMAPLLGLLLTSFQNVSWVDGQAIRSWAGLDHYRAMFGDVLFGAGILNSIVFALGAVSGQMILGFALALLVSKVYRARVIYRTVFILPILIPGIVIGAIWKLMLNYDFGLVNKTMGLAWLGPFDWLGSSQTALMSVIVVDIWHWTPFCFLLFLAGLESLPQDVYDATKIDGANAWQEMVYVTLPLMLPTIAVTFAFRLILAFKVFDEVYLLTKGGPGTATEVVSFTLYQRFFTENKAGYGSALSVTVIFLVCLLLVVMFSVRRRSEEQS